jgi:hypothetical protein
MLYRACVMIMSFYHYHPHGRHLRSMSCVLCTGAGRLTAGAYSAYSKTTLYIKAAVSSQSAGIYTQIVCTRKCCGNTQRCACRRGLLGYHVRTCKSSINLDTVCADGRYWGRPWRLRASVVHGWRAHREGARDLVAGAGEDLVASAGRATLAGREAEVVRCWCLADGSAGAVGVERVRRDVFGESGRRIGGRVQLGGLLLHVLMAVCMRRTTTLLNT